MSVTTKPSGTTIHEAAIGVKKTDGTFQTVINQDGTVPNVSTQTTEKTVATTGATDSYVIVPETGVLTGVDFSGINVLATSDTNYVTFTLTNLGQAGAGTTVMLAASAANTTKATGGTALAANAKRQLTVHGTAANLAVTAGDRLKLSVTATGTLANTVTGSTALLRFAAN